MPILSVYLLKRLDYNIVICTLFNLLDDSVISADYKLTVEKKDITHSAAVFTELKTRSLQGKANKIQLNFVLQLSHLVIYS